MQEVTFSNAAEETILLPVDAVETAENNLAADPEEHEAADEPDEEEASEETADEEGDHA